MKHLAVISFILIVLMCNVSAYLDGLMQFIQQFSGVKGRIQHVTDMPKEKQKRIEGYFKKVIELYNEEFEKKRFQDETLKNAYVKYVYNGTNVMARTYNERNKKSDTVIFKESEEQTHGSYAIVFSSKDASCLVVFQVTTKGIVTHKRDYAGYTTSHAAKCLLLNLLRSTGMASTITQKNRILKDSIAHINQANSYMRQRHT